jgi:hypothetical protein
MKRTKTILIKNLTLYFIFVLLAWVALAFIYEVEYMGALVQLSIVLVIDSPLLVVGIWGGLYIDRINNDPPQNFSQQQAIQRHRLVDTWMGLIPGPAALFGVSGMIFLVIRGSGSALGGSLLVIIFTSMTLFGIILTDLCKQYLIYLRKRSASTVDKILSGDQPPVLYLRSFIDDDWAEKRNTIGTTEEEEISQAFQPFGPLIAIGQPGERLPDLGAARAYFEDDEWQTAIQHYMDIANLVVIRAGFSQGLLWEIRNAVQKLNPEQLVLLIRLKREKYDQFRKQVDGYFPKGLPNHTEHDIRIFDEDSRSTPWRFCSLLGVIHFNSDWTPYFEVFKIADFIVSGRKRVYGMIRSALGPVYQKLDRSWPEDPQLKSKSQKVIGYGCIILVLVAACLLVALIP